MFDIIFGDNHLFGINHLSLDKAEEYRNKFSQDTALTQVFSMLREHGVDQQMISAHLTAGKVCKIAIQEHPNLIIHPVIPYAHSINDEAAAHGLVRTAYDLLKPDLLDTFNLFFSLLAPWKEVKIPKSSIRRFVDKQLDLFGTIPGKNKGVLFMNNVFTDLLIGMGAIEWFEHFSEICIEKGYKAGVITYNPSFFVSNPMPNLELCIQYNHKGFLNNINEIDLTRLFSTNKCWAMGIFGAGAYIQNDVISDPILKSFSKVVFASSKEERLVNFLNEIN